jgi:hypothetical protein
MIGFGIKLALDSFADLSVAFQGISKIKEGVSESLTVLFETAASLEGGDSEPIRAIGNTAEKLAGIPAATTAATFVSPAPMNSDSLTSAIRELINIVKSPPASGKGQEAAIYMDGKKVASAIIPYINKGVINRMGLGPGSLPSKTTGRVSR